MYFDLYLDMDEVIYDLSDLIRQKVNKEFNKDFEKGFNKRYWWKDYGIEKEYFEKLLERQGLFIEGNPVENSIEIINKLHKEGFDIHIITFPQHNLYCFYEKIAFIKKFFPWLEIDSNFHTTGNKGLMAKGDRILIDDNIKYLSSWSLCGGISIAFGNHGWNRGWYGFKSPNWIETYKLIHELESGMKNSDGDVPDFKVYMPRGK